MKLVFFVDSAWRRVSLQHTPLLYPFWGNSLNRVKNPFQFELFERHSFDTSFYLITEKLEEADMILMPYSHNTARKFAPDILKLCAENSAASGKPLLIDGIGDIENEVSTPNSVVLRYGGYRFLKKKNEIHIPPYADDLLEIYNGGTLVLREKPQKPSVSFAGWATLTPGQELRAIIKGLPDKLRALFDSRYGACKKGVFFRREAVRVLTKSEKITTNFLVRRSFSGHHDTAEKSPDILRREFIENLLESDYALDVRGDANASIRLFEILSLGRIPVILDTERNLPFSDKINYSDFSLIIDFRDLEKLPEKIAEFNKSISEEKYRDMQRLARAAYLQYFRVDALTRHIMKEIQKKINCRT
jgi:hypothetical protein